MTDVAPAGQALLDALAEAAARLADASDAWVLRAEGDRLRLLARHGARRPPKAGASGLAIRRTTVYGRAVLDGRTVQVGAEVALPLSFNGAAVGAIAIRRATARPLSLKQLAALEAFARQAALAVRQLETLEAQDRNLGEALEQQTATAEILRAISGSPTDLQPILDTVVRAAARFCGAADVMLLRLDGAVLRGAAGLGQVHDSIIRQLGRLAALELPVTRGSVSGRAVMDRQVVHVHDLIAAPGGEFPEGRELARRFGHHTTMAAPLLREGAPVGAIVLFRGVVDPFSDRQLALLRTFADQAAIAIENVRLFTELDAKNRDLTETLEQQTATGEILRVISSSPTDVQPVFDTIADSAARLCEADFSVVMRLEGGLLHLVSLNTSPDERTAYQSLFPRPPGRQYVVGRAVVEGRPVHIEDVKVDPEYDPRTLAVLQRAASYRTYLGVPILRNGVPIGVIGCGRRAVRPFAPGQIELVKTFADQAVIAIENVRLFTELDAKNRDLTETLEQQTATSEILRIISTSPTDLHPVLQTVAENAARLCAANDGHIWQRDDNDLRLAASWGGQPIARRRLTISRQSVAGRAVLDQRPVHVPDLAQALASEFPDSRGMKELGYRTILVVPLLREGTAIGAIMIRRTEVRPFTDKQLELVKTFADQAVIAIENVRLFTELDAKNRDLTETLEQQTATGEILRVISSSPTDVQPVFDTIAQNAKRLCAAQFCQLYRFDGTLLHFVAHDGLGPEGAEAVRRAYPMAPGRGSAAARSVLSGAVEHIPDVHADPDYGHGTVARAANFRSILAVPMVRDGIPIGSIAVARVDAGHFPDRQLELLKTFADQAVIAIENVRLFTELEAKNRDLTETLEQQTATGDILRVISSSPTDVQPVFDTIADSAARLCDARLAFVFRFDGSLLHLAAHHGLTREGTDALGRAWPRAPSPGTAAGRSILDRGVAHIPDVQADPTYVLGGVAEVADYRSTVGVPMLRDGIPIGTITVSRAQAGPFSARQIALLQTFADQAVIAIENVRLFTELEVRNRDLTETLEQQTATAEILRVISSSPTDVQPVFSAIADAAMRLCGAASSIVTTFDGEVINLSAHAQISPEGAEVFRRVYPRRPSRGLASGRAILTGAIVHISDLLTEPEYEHRDLVQAAAFRGVLAVPMLRDGTPIGTINVHKSEPNRFTDKQVELLQTFAAQAVIAIENVRLFTELEAKNRDLTETLEQQTATSEILRVISSSPTDVQPVFDTIARSALRLCDARWSAVTRFDGRVIELAAHHGLGDAAAVRAVERAFPRAPSEHGATDRAIVGRVVGHYPDVLEDPSYQFQDMARAAGYRSMLAVPMVREGQALGAITVAGATARTFSDRQIELLKTFGDQAVIAIENVRLFKELEAKNRDLTETLEQQTATAEILRVISRSPTDTQPVFETIAENAARLCEARDAVVYLVDGDVLNPVARHGPATAGPIPLIPGTLGGRTVIERRTMHVADLQAETGDLPVGAAISQREGTRSMLSVPLLHEDRAIGTIGIRRFEVRPFSDTHIALLQTFAAQAVIAIENVRLFTELQARNRDLTETLEQQTATSEILRVISRSPTNVEPVFDIIGERAEKLCDAAISVVSRFDGERLHLVSLHGVAGDGVDLIRRAFPMRPDDETVSARALRSRAVVHVPDVLVDARYEQKGAARAGGYRGCLAVPMVREGQVVGVIFVARTRPGSFTDTQVELLKTFADQAVIAVENVRLFQELDARTSDLTRSVGELRALGEVSQAVSSTLELETVLETIVSRAVELSGSRSGLIYEFDALSERFQVRATHQITPEHLAAIRDSPIRLGEGAIGRAGVIREPVLVADIEAERQLVAPQVRDILARQGLRSLLALPLVREDRLLGGLVIIRREGGAFSPAVVQTMRAFAAQSVLAIHNAGLFREIQRRKQYADAIVETSPVAIVTVDLDGRVVGWNPGAEQLFGHTEAEALGRPMEDLVATPDVVEGVRDNIQRTLAGESIRAIGRRARKDGTPVDVEISSVPVVVDGARMGMLGIYHDITDLLRARREAEAANEAKSAFLATMSHEIRTPLNAVIGMSGLLLNTPLADEQREYAEIVRQSGDALLTVINDILDFSKIEAGRLELEAQPFDLRECVEGALDLVATRAAEKGLDLAYVVGDGAPIAIVGDVTRLRQVLLNLLSNAVKFTERGEVVVSVSARRLDGSEGLHELTFSVRDTGIGIPADRLGRLFQSFSQVDASTTRRYGGTGLGLAISQRLTELMGGRISVTSKVGVGSEFRFAIRAPAAVSLPVEARRDLSGIQHSIRGKRVLVVDDNATNRRIVTTHLTTWGLPARATESPLEAAEWIRAGERFDVGILDMHMPEMDGVALARAIRVEPAGAALPLILFTSLGRREARADEEGFAAYLHKPIKPSQLFDALVSVLGDQPVHVRERGAAQRDLDPDLARRHPLRILLAEDNVVNQKVALRLLAQMGYRADVAANGLEAVDAVERQTYDVVLMDVQMPELDGFEASREINRRWPGNRRPRIVAMTANAMQGDRELCVAAGMDDYVAKPVRIEELVSALERTPRRAAGVAPVGGVAAAAEEAAAAAPGSAASGPSEPTATDAIDRVTFDGLIRSMGAPFVAELIDTFVEDARELTAQLPAALARRDLDAFRRAAHSLKSTSESLGATALAALARDLEAIARAGSLEGVDARLRPVAAEYARVAHALRKLRRDLSA